jgi:hypothetical protein
MAGSMVHGGMTLPISIIAFLIGGWQSSQIPIWFLGVFMDYFDHLSRKRIKKLLRGDIEPLPAKEHINSMHTWWALASVCAFSIWTWNLFPFIAYAFHIAIDSRDRGVVKVQNEPLPLFFHQFWPEKWKSEIKPPDLLIWPQKIKKFLRRE